MKKISYNEAIDPPDNVFFHEGTDPYNQFTPLGMLSDPDESANYERDGKNLEDEDSKRKNRIKKLKEIKEKKEPVLQPTPFYENMYNTWPGVEGLYSSPLEYYGGSIADSPDAITNPYNNTYQSASNKRIQILKAAHNFAS